MTNKTIVYSKQTDESPIPLTARIEWLPDGTIKPLMYWTPDGTRFNVTHVCETTSIAFLKDKGVGLRFKVKAELVETPEYDDRLLHTKHETYLYFASNWFCGKNFIDGRYGHPGKEYIPVTLDVFHDGDYKIIYFKAQGLRYMVDKTVEIEPRGSFLAGGVGIWHKVEARLVNADNDEDFDLRNPILRISALFFEVNKWFVSVKTV